MNQTGAKPVLLAVTELGGYPDFTSLYESAGYEVVHTNAVRKAVKLIRQHRPAVIVAEFNYQSDFRDRTSSLETLMSSIQGNAESRVIVFYEKESAPQYQRFLASHTVHASLTFPIDEAALRDAL